MFLLYSQSKRNISKIKKQRNHSQLKDQEHSPERTNNEADLFRLIDTYFKKEITKILKELRRSTEMKSNVKRNYKEEPRKIRKLICRDES